MNLLSTRCVSQWMSNVFPANAKCCPKIHPNLSTTHKNQQIVLDVDLSTLLLQHLSEFPRRPSNTKCVSCRFVCVCNAAKGLKRKTPKPKKPSAVCWHFMVPRNLVQWLPAGLQPGPGSPVAVSALSANEACHAAGRHTANRPVGTWQTMAIPKSTGFSKFGWFSFSGKPRNQPERDKYVTA